MTIKREDLETGNFQYTDPDIDVSAPRLPPIHPGEILREEFLEPSGISAYRLATDIHVTPNRVSEMLHGRRAMTADTALRLGRYFGNAAAFWMHLQSNYDLATTDRAHGEKIAKEVHFSQRMVEPDLDGRHRDQNGQINSKHGNMKAGTLKETYSAGFGKGFRSDTTLSAVLSSKGNKPHSSSKRQRAK